MCLIRKEGHGKQRQDGLAGPNVLQGAGLQTRDRKWEEGTSGKVSFSLEADDRG